MATVFLFGMAITNGVGNSLNMDGRAFVERSMPPRAGGDNAYQSKYWPILNGAADEGIVFSTLWGPAAGAHSDRENTLLDVIGAYDLLRMQGLTAERALFRLGLHKSRDELVEELDSETAHRISMQAGAAKERPRPTAC